MRTAVEGGVANTTDTGSSNEKAHDASASSPSDDKEEKTEDPTSKQTSNSGEATDWDPLTTVDSALLSALLDPRERKALLRLERVLVNFINSALNSIEVGGAYNTIILGENEGVERGYKLEDCMNPQNIQEFQLQQARGLRQTSFQRLVLHRLADRFGIVREVIPQNENIITSLNLIRLIKTGESSVPRRMIAEVDSSVLVGWRNPLARENRSQNMGSNSSGGCVYNNCGGYNAWWCLNDEQEMHQLSDQMAASTLRNPLATQPNKRMVIMKRSSTSGSNNEDVKGKKEGKSRNRKKLADKEKAYEEARARIFGIETSAPVESTAANEDTTGGDGESAHSANGGSSPVVKAEKQQLNPQVVEFKPQSSIEESHHSIISMGSDCEIVEPYENGKSETKESNAPIASKEKKNTPDEAGNIAQRKNKNKSKSGKTPPSSNSSKATGKAVYRNRQQEEADPDFKRRSGPSYYTPQYTQNVYQSMVNAAMGGQATGQHRNTVIGGQHPAQHAGIQGHNGQQYYGQQQFYPNHFVSPQSPYIGHCSGYHPQAMQKINVSPPATTPQAADAPDCVKQAENIFTSEVASVSTNDDVGPKVVALKPEDFPSLQ